MHKEKHHQTGGALPKLLNIILTFLSPLTVAAIPATKLGASVIDSRWIKRRYSGESFCPLSKVLSSGRGNIAFRSETTSTQSTFCKVLGKLAPQLDGG
ncbi:MAG: hypothetical protein HY006_04470 [Candidatus Sungbacteria bacterium]|nr:hypothetical protein [Candidatus Sungbacteria bacterium]